MPTQLTPIEDTIARTKLLVEQSRRLVAEAKAMRQCEARDRADSAVVVARARLQVALSRQRRALEAFADTEPVKNWRLVPNARHGRFDGVVSAAEAGCLQDGVGLAPAIARDGKAPRIGPSRAGVALEIEHMDTTVPIGSKCVDQVGDVERGRLALVFRLYRGAQFIRRVHRLQHSKLTNITRRFSKGAWEMRRFKPSFDAESVGLRWARRCAPARRSKRF